MKQFTDSQGRAWALAITLGAAQKVRAALDVDLLNPAALSDDGAPVMQRLLYDDVFLCLVVAELIKDQLERASVSQDEFLNALDGEAIGRLDEAFWAEYRFFFLARGKEWAVKAIEIDLETRKTNERKALESLSESLNGTTSATLQAAPESTTSEN